MSHLGRSALTCHVNGRQDGRLCFLGDFVCVFADSRQMKPIPIPPLMRANLQSFAARQGAAFDDIAAH